MFFDRNRFYFLDIAVAISLGNLSPTFSDEKSKNLFIENYNDMKINECIEIRFLSHIRKNKHNMLQNPSPFMTNTCHKYTEQR